MERLPLVSICIPTYNGATFLEACLQSALEQTYSSLEILISDDGSTDETVAIVNRYRQRHNHIRLVKNESSGMVNNWNNCIQQAKGEWIKLLFQDDVLKPTCVEKILTSCITHRVDVGLCRREFIIHDDVPKPIRFDFKYRLVRPERIYGEAEFLSPEMVAAGVAEHLRQNVLGEPTCYFFHKRIFEQTGLFNPEFRQMVDYEFIIRLALKKGMAFPTEVLALFRVHNKSESSANANKDKSTAQRNVAATVGDNILLLYFFLRNPEFAALKELIGEEVLNVYIRHLYYSSCKRQGISLLNAALQPMRSKYDELGKLNYSLLNYIRYRRRFKNWERYISNHE